MKQLTVATLGSAGLAVLLAGVGLLIAVNMDHALARFPGSQRVRQARFDLLSVYNGRMSETITYQTNADLDNVGRWYRERFGAQTPTDDTVNSRSQCLTLVKTRQWMFVHGAFQATLCSSPPGTSVFEYQTVYLLK